MFFCARNPLACHFHLIVMILSLERNLASARLHDFAARSVLEY